MSWRQAVSIDVAAAKKVLLSILGIGLVLLTWFLIYQIGWLGNNVPSIASVADVFTNPTSRSNLVSATQVTGGEALRGFAMGLGLAMIAGIVAIVIPRFRGGFDQLATF